MITAGRLQPSTNMLPAFRYSRWQPMTDRFWDGLVGGQMFHYWLPASVCMGDEFTLDTLIWHLCELNLLSI